MERIDGDSVRGSLLDAESVRAEDLIQHFRREARKQKKSVVWVDKVIRGATSGDYDHLMKVLSAHFDECELEGT